MGLTHLETVSLDSLKCKHVSIKIFGFRAVPCRGDYHTWPLF